MNHEQIIKENNKRIVAKNQPYNPVTGLGCYGERFCIELKEYGGPLYLPIEMLESAFVRQLRNYTSISAYLKDKLKESNEMLIKAFKLKIAEKRYDYDYEFFAVMCETITDKLTAEQIPFRLNRGQRRLLARMEQQRRAGLPIRIQVLKSRQWGCSTLIQMYMKWIQIVHKKNWNSVVCAHVKDAAINVRAMYENSIDQMPPVQGIKYSIRNFKQTQNIKYIPESNCRITVGTAEEPDSIKSQDIKMVQFSEEAMYPDTPGKSPEALEAAIIPSIPNIPYTMIVRESTANGMGDYFYEQWLKAKAEETLFEAVFVEWFLMDIYSCPFDGYYNLPNGKRKKGSAMDFLLTMNDYEMNLFNNHSELTLENLNWRRQMRAQMPSETKMKQDFPSDDIEAFQDSGSLILESEHVERQRKHCKKPVMIGTLESDADPRKAILDFSKRKDILKNIRFIPDEEAYDHLINSDRKLSFMKAMNKLHVFEYPDTETKVKDRYVVVFDPQKGISDKADFGFIKVIDRYWMMYGGKPEVVALFYGHIDKDVTIWIAAQIAKWYNDALLVVESNTYETSNGEKLDDDSEFIFDTIAEYYGNLYSRTPADKIAEGAPVKYGFNTNRTTKPMIINNYIAILREDGYIERDDETLNEARVYEKKKNGSYGAKEGKHDDRIMATMIGLYVCYELPIPHIIKPYKETKKQVTVW
jgi:hypothetical protein